MGGDNRKSHTKSVREVKFEFEDRLDVRATVSGSVSVSMIDVLLPEDVRMQLIKTARDEAVREGLPAVDEPDETDEDQHGGTEADAPNRQ